LLFSSVITSVTSTYCYKPRPLTYGSLRNIFCSHVVLSILVGISHSFGETPLTGLQTNLKMEKTRPYETSVYLF